MDQVADQQILRGVAATLSWQNLGSDGEIAAPSGAVTVGVTRADGTVLVSPGTATSGSGSDPRTYSLTSANNQLLDLLTVTWTDGGDSSTHTTYVDVVGGYYFTIAEARLSDASLFDGNKYTNAAIATARREVEEEFERICGVAFVPRFRREVQSGTGGAELLLDMQEPRVIRGVRNYTDLTGYTDWTSDELSSLVLDDWGLISSRTGVTFECGNQNLVIAYEHGHSRPPGEVKRAALTRLRSRLNMALSAVPDRASQFTVTEGGTYRLDTAGALKTGLPDVDGVLDRYSRRAPGVG